MRLARRDRAHLSEEPTAAPPPNEAEAASPRRTLRAERVPSTEAPPEEESSAAEEPAANVEDAHGAPPEKRRSSKGRIRAMFDEQVAQSREDAEREAALELRTFMEPARQQLLLNVPGSSSPEEAEAMLASQAAVVLDAPVEVRPEAVVDLRNPSSMRAYPPAEKLSNRVLRLADRHWSKDKPRPSAEIVAEMSAMADREFARKPSGTQRCLAQHASLRCRGVFAYHADDQADGASLLACPSCGTSHTWDSRTGTWMLRPDVALGARTMRGALSSGG